MARKRMISPEIWESQDFSQLSDVAKIVFISLFSHADDEGRGRADPTFIKNITFPYDENRRVADIKSALSEIARCMSVQFYSVNGIAYYFMISWERWQKVDKPSKSKLPPPPKTGVGGDIPNCEVFDEYSPNTPRTFAESSSTNRIEKNRKECVYTRACAREDTHTFVKPTVKDIATYIAEIGKRMDARRFYDFYESKGWMIGNQPMKDWRACVRAWEPRAGECAGVSEKAREKAEADTAADMAAKRKQMLLETDAEFYELEKAIRLANIRIAKGEDVDISELTTKRDEILARNGIGEKDV